ncbi:protein translocase SEC61 complex subunit gamma [Candidatus Woesearchaeota archaeon]|nr:protein translocase SEC61 complex subunit gamma [Nanoarchaeota archaeon]MCB9370220.1 protein translocase SEC61 complex subunit gamma [Candidatus Woesearchaeota archaeon]USN44745.1 MAG: protein translocase SEC61 complex subunit gamma [Candidatus Woesearchaeota archaeon]
MVSKFISDIRRVWKVTKKPSKKDYFLTLKIVLIGFLIIGFIGFTIEFIWILLLRRFFGG